MNRNRLFFKVTGTLVLSLFLVTPVLAAVSVDPALPGYAADGQVAGSLKSIGSDTMNNEMALWAEGFRGFHPEVKVEVEGKGSSTAPPALIAGATRVREVLGWQPRYDDLEEIARSSLAWERKLLERSQ